MKKLFKKVFNPTLSRLDQIDLIAKLNTAYTRSSASFTNRKINETSPQSWESSGFSQNGEDGIIDFLISKLKNSNRYFLEIGSSDGIENNTSYLAHIKKFAGLQVEGNLQTYKRALQTKAWLVECFNCFVKQSTVDQIIQKCLYKNPDVFSIDIDGMDYYITKMLFEKGIKPKIVVVEYNSAFGPDASLTVKYSEDFDMFDTQFPFLYYGVSINGWKKYFTKLGYQFVTVDSNGVNAFFIDPTQFDPIFTSNISGLDFEENKHQLRYFQDDWRGQFGKIQNLDFSVIV